MELARALREIRTNEAKVVSIKNCKLDARAALRLSVALKFNKSVTELCLENAGVCGEALKPLCDMLKQNSFITSLKLPENSKCFGSSQQEAALALADLFRGNKTITHLDVGGTSMKGVHLLALCPSLVSSRLEELFLDKAYIDSVESATNIAQMVEMSTSLTRLSLSRCQLVDNRTDALFKGFLNNKKITDLNVSMMSLGSKGVQSLVEVLRVNHTLQRLKLKKCHGKPQDFVQIVQLGQNLSHLTLDGNVLRADDASLIAEALAGNRSLILLSVANCELNDDACTSICEALATIRC